MVHHDTHHRDRAPSLNQPFFSSLLGRTQLPGRLVPNTRIFAPDCVRAIASFLVRENLAKHSPR
jgi:hypothetical protein